MLTGDTSRCVKCGELFQRRHNATNQRRCRRCNALRYAQHLPAADPETERILLDLEDREPTPLEAALIERHIAQVQAATVYRPMDQNRETDEVKYYRIYSRKIAR